jgi:hypothetical protein
MELVMFGAEYCANCDTNYIGTHTCHVHDITVDKKMIDMINNMKIIPNDFKCACGRAVKFENRFKHRRTAIHKKLLDELKHGKTDSQI